MQNVFKNKIFMVSNKYGRYDIILNIYYILE